jgi:hypothetical protein
MDRPRTAGPSGASRHGTESALRGSFGKGQELQQLRGCARANAGQQGASRAVRILQAFFPATPINDSPERVRGRSVGDWSFRVPEAQRTEDLLPDRPMYKQCAPSPQRFGATFFGGAAPNGPPEARAHRRDPVRQRSRAYVLTRGPRSPRIRAEDSASIRKHEPKGQIRFFRPRLAGRPPHKIEKSEAVSSQKGKSSRSRIFAVLPCSLSLSLSLSFHSPRPRLFADSVQKAS